MSAPTTAVYVAGKPVEGEVHEVHEHISPMSLYIKVFGALLVLTALTYGVSYMDLGNASLTVAMAVAVVKASLVCMYFMHLKYDDRFNVFVFMSSVLFVAIFFAITIFDLVSRDAINVEQDTFFRKKFGAPYGFQPPEPPEGAAHGPAEH